MAPPPKIEWHAVAPPSENNTNDISNNVSNETEKINYYDLQRTSDFFESDETEINRWREYVSREDGLDDREHYGRPYATYCPYCGEVASVGHECLGTVYNYEKGTSTIEEFHPLADKVDNLDLPICTVCGDYIFPGLPHNHKEIRYDQPICEVCGYPIYPNRPHDHEKKEKPNNEKEEPSEVELPDWVYKLPLPDIAVNIPFNDKRKNKFCIDDVAGGDNPLYSYLKQPELIDTTYREHRLYLDYEKLDNACYIIRETYKEIWYWINPMEEKIQKLYENIKSCDADLVNRFHYDDYISDIKQAHNNLSTHEEELFDKLSKVVISIVSYSEGKGIFTCYDANILDSEFGMDSSWPSLEIEPIDMPYPYLSRWKIDQDADYYGVELSDEEMMSAIDAIPEVGEARFANKYNHAYLRENFDGKIIYYPWTTDGSCCEVRLGWGPKYKAAKQYLLSKLEEET